MFEPGVSVKFCSVSILDDTMTEGLETFSVHLAPRGIGVKVDQNRSTVDVAIIGPNDGQYPLCSSVAVFVLRLPIYLPAYFSIMLVSWLPTCQRLTYLLYYTYLLVCHDFSVCRFA